MNPILKNMSLVHFLNISVIAHMEMSITHMKMTHIRDKINFHNRKL